MLPHHTKHSPLMEGTSNLQLVATQHQTHRQVIRLVRHLFIRVEGKQIPRPVLVQGLNTSNPQYQVTNLKVNQVEVTKLQLQEVTKTTIKVALEARLPGVGVEVTKVTQVDIRVVVIRREVEKVVVEEDIRTVAVEVEDIEGKILLLLLLLQFLLTLLVFIILRYVGWFEDCFVHCPEHLETAKPSLYKLK